MRVSAPIAHIKDMEAGDGIGYGHKWVAKTNTKIGVVYFGYADGFPAINTGELYVYSRKTKIFYQIVGSICMDQIFINLGSSADLDAGDEIEIFGDEPCLIGDIATSASLLHANILSNLRDMSNRAYI
jgi:alanine racemase